MKNYDILEQLYVSVMSYAGSVVYLANFYSYLYNTFHCVPQKPSTCALPSCSYMFQNQLSCKWITNLSQLWNIKCQQDRSLRSWSFSSGGQWENPNSFLWSLVTFCITLRLLFIYCFLGCHMAPLKMFIDVISTSLHIASILFLHQFYFGVTLED